MNKFFLYIRIGLLSLLAGTGTAEVENFGIRGDHKSEFERILENPGILRIAHPAIARLWAEKFLYRYGFDMHVTAAQRLGRTLVAPSSGDYPDKRRVQFRFMPRNLAEQLAPCLSIKTLLFEADSVTAEVLLFSEGRTCSKILITFPCPPEEQKELKQLLQSLRLRMELNCKILRIEGKQKESIVFLNAAVTDASIRIFDITNILFEKHENVKVVPDEISPTDILMTEDSDETGLAGEVTQLVLEVEKDFSEPDDAPDTIISFFFDAADLTDLPYSEGLQPFNRGWFLKDAFPGQAADVIAVCNHIELPASFSKKLDAPLPPGLYKVAMRSTYFRSRFFDSILRIKLGDDEVELAFWWPGLTHEGNTPDDWIFAPALQITEPADEITFTALQIGGGDRGQAPPYFRRWIAFDRFFITNVMNDESFLTE